MPQTCDWQQDEEEALLLLLLLIGIDSSCVGNRTLGFDKQEDNSSNDGDDAAAAASADPPPYDEEHQPQEERTAQQDARSAGTATRRRRRINGIVNRPQSAPVTAAQPPVRKIYYVKVSCRVRAAVPAAADWLCKMF